MRKVLLLLLMFNCVIAVGQKNWFWANVDKSPLYARIVSTDTKNGTGSTSHSLTNIPGGALIVLTLQGENDYANGSVSSTPALTWTKRADAQATSSGDAEIWTAVHTAGGSLSITASISVAKQTSVAWVIENQESSLGGASATATGQSTPSRTITTTKENSILICVSSDWNAISGSSRAYRDDANEIYYFHTSSAATGYHYYKQANTIGTYTEGLTNPGGQAAGTAILEIRSKVLPPAPVNLFAVNAQNGTGTNTHSLIGVPPGSKIVITAQTEDESGDATISSSPALTWTMEGEALATGSGGAEIWSAVFTAGGNITISNNFGNNKQSSVAWVITNQEAVAGGAVAVAVSQTTPSRTITTTKVNSILICVSSDWNAIPGTSRAYRDNANEIHYFHSTNATTGYHYYKLANSIGTYTEGLTQPTGQSAGTVIIEIRSQ